MMTAGLLVNIIFYCLATQVIASEDASSLLLSQLLSEYDYDVSPDKPVKVNVTIHLDHISEVSEENMSITMSIYLQQQWVDQRLIYNRSRIEDDKLHGGANLINRIWKPDTFLANELDSRIHKATVLNGLMEISPNGQVFYSLRMTVTASCPMNLHLFPHDSQECGLEIESYAYSIKYIDLHAVSVNVGSSMSLSQFMITNMSFSDRVLNLKSGVYKRLSLVIRLTRLAGPYIMQMYLPCIAIVVISFLPLWFSPELYFGERISIGIATVLTMTVLSATSNTNLPKVSYIKAMDIYFFISFAFCFVSLVQSSILLCSKRTSSVTKLPQSEEGLLLKVEETGNNDVEKPKTSSTDEKIAKTKNRRFKPIYIDYINRFLFPMLYIAFHFWYFWYYAPFSISRYSAR